MASFTQTEIRFLKDCHRLYRNDGYPLPTGSVLISPNYQEELLTSALNKLTNVLLHEPLTKKEATLLLGTIHHVSANYTIDDSSFDLLDLYNRLSALAGGEAL